MSFSIRLTEDERRLAESYARIHSYSLSEAFKKALFEKIEDEYDSIYDAKDGDAEILQFENYEIVIAYDDCIIRPLAR